MKMLNPHPALRATSKSLEILLPVHAAGELLFHINETEQASLTTRLEYGTTKWKMEWISKRMQLQLTCVTGAAYSVS